MSFRQEKIKKGQHGLNLIAFLFYGQKRIKNCYRQCIFFGRDETKIVHISVNTSEVKYAMNKTKDEEPLVTNNSVINVSIYFKLFKRVNL